MANPGLNGLIFGVLVIGILLAFRQVIRLFREVRWVNASARGPGAIDRHARRCSRRWRPCWATALGTCR